MEIIRVELPNNHEIYKVSDVHLGSILHHSDGWQEVLDVVGATKNAFLTLDGDLIEGITVDDPRFAYGLLDHKIPTPLHQCNQIIEDLYPIRKKILCIGDGNHEMKLQSYGNLIRDIICKGLGVPYATFSYKLHVCSKSKNSKLLYKVFSTHGSRYISSTADDPIRRSGNMALQVKNALKRKASDCAIMTMGHAHKLIVEPPKSQLVLTDNGEEIRGGYTEANLTAEYIPEDLRWYICSGSLYKLYFMGHSGYAERFGYDPVELGYAVITLTDGLTLSARKEVL